MKSKALLLCLILSMVATVACQGKNSKKTGISRSRLRGAGDSPNAPGAQSSNRTWGEIHRGTMSVTNFWNELYWLTYPQLANASEGEQLGYVDGTQGNASTGVRFWGYANVSAGKQLESSSAEILIAIYDDRTAEGQEPIRIHISPKVQGFVGNSLSSSGSQMTLTFEDQLGKIILSGSGASGGYFEGDVKYTNSLTGNGAPRSLGKFKVKYCGFFKC